MRKECVNQKNEEMDIFNTSEKYCRQARLAQSVERQALNLVVEGSSPSVGDFFL